MLGVPGATMEVGLITRMIPIVRLPLHYGLRTVHI